MSQESSSRRAATRDASRLALDEAVVGRLQDRVPEVAAHAVRAITVEVPPYANALAGPMGTRITSAVELALGGFLRLASASRSGSGAGAPMTAALDGAYELGRGEARSGRTMDALLAAYRVGARESWREFSRVAVERGLPSDEVARFAELVFAYIDELSAASAAGHADELATTGRVRDRYRTRLALSLLRGDPSDRLLERAQRAGWEPPRSLAAVVLPTEHASRAMASLDERTLRADEDLPDTDDDDEQAVSVLLVADAHGVRRAATLTALRGLDAYVGPARGWDDARTSYLRAQRARRIGLVSEADRTCDTDAHLTRLVVAADPVALADLRARALAPLAGVRPSSAERLVETLRAWLLHQGRRDDVAAALHVHPQTVRYRMTQLRELYGSGLDDPETVAAITVALA